MASESEQIKQLYEFSEQLDVAGTEAAKHIDLYRGLLNGAKGAPKAKSLAAQLIPRYFKYFPELLDEGINALTDLCEEEDIQIRVLAVRAFPTICKDTAKAVPKAADILGQLLQTEIVVEQDNVKNSLISLLHVDPKAVLRALFVQILERDENQRERAFQFLRDKVYPLREELFHNEEIERNFAEEIRKALADVSGDEFKICMDFLSSLKIYKQNAKELLDILAEQADLKSDFKPTDTDNIERLISCMHLALPVFQKGATQSGQTFLNYLSNKVLPLFDQLSEAHQNTLLQAVAEISPYAVADDARILLPAVYSLFQSHVPAGKVVDAPKINFTYIEALLFTFHLLGSKAPGAVAQLCGVTPVYTGQPSDMVSIEGADEKLKDFKARLQYLVTKCEKAINDMNTALKGVAMDKEKKKTVDNVLTITKNIQELAKLLLKQPKPSFLNKTGGAIQPSWQKSNQSQQPKRKQPDTKPAVAVETGGKKSKPSGFTGVYVPPGKQSGGRGVAPPNGNNQRGRGGFRGGRGGFNQRGRGGGRGRGKW